MADKEPKKQLRLKHRKAPETVRERAEKQSERKVQPKKKIRSKIYRPLSVLRKAGQKEFNPIPVPKGRIGRILGKRGSFIPKVLKNAWGELAKVSWSSRKDAAKLTLAVLVFAGIFAIFVQIFGFAFERLVKVMLIK